VYRHPRRCKETALAAKITSRDFKRARSSGLRLDLGRWKEFGFGLALGLSLSVMVLVWQNYREKQAAIEAAQQPKPEPRAAATKETDEAAPNYDFYERLQNIEVQIPEKPASGADSREPAPATIAKPGVYVIQAGSFRKQTDADRVQAQLRKLGIEATVQPVQIETGEVFRVRIGPLSDLTEINRLRARLRAADFDFQSFRVGD
jgi:cell division septation protein DedD